MEQSDSDAKKIDPPTEKKAFKALVAGIRSLARKKKAEPEAAEEMVCCKGIVHIAYRAIADDRLYISYSRKWNEIRFFRPNGLRVFCADCRSRVL